MACINKYDAVCVHSHHYSKPYYKRNALKIFITVFTLGFTDKTLLFQVLAWHLGVLCLNNQELIFNHEIRRCVHIYDW